MKREREKKGVHLILVVCSIIVNLVWCCGGGCFISAFNVTQKASERTLWSHIYICRMSVSANRDDVVVFSIYTLLSIARLWLYRLIIVMAVHYVVIEGMCPISHHRT